MEDHGVPSSTSRPQWFAQKIIVAVFKVVLPDVATRLEGLSEIAELIGLGDHTQISTLGQLLENNARHLASRIEQLESDEDPEIDEVTKWTAINAVLESITSLTLTRSDIIDMRLDADAIYGLVEPAAEAIWVSLDEPDVVMGYGKRYLREAIAFLIAIVRQLPDLNTELMLSNLDLTYKIYQLINDAINRVVLARSPDETSVFESKYLSWVMTSNDSMEVFGLDVPEELRSQPIDVAYITLKANPLGDPVAQAEQFRWAANNEETANDEGEADSVARHGLRVDEALAAAAKSSKSSSDIEGEIIPGARILVTGRAGSGKTTIGQWLAIRAARHSFPESLREWNACVPFVVRLREAFSRDASRDPDIRSLIQLESLRKQLPNDWIETRLCGESIIILDGYDELSRAAKVRFQTWLKDLCGDFPKLTVILTSRPEGLDARWLAILKFVQLELQPMDPSDIKRCIAAWYRALVMINSSGREAHRKNQARLISDIERQDTLQELAATPLLCAMLCAFYAYNRSAAAPETRNQLYREVVKTLVDARERERNPNRSDLAILHLTEKLQLLQGLASCMTDNQMSSMRCVPSFEDPQEAQWPSGRVVTAREVVEDRLARMSFVQSTADEALTVLLDRSVVFRPIGYNLARFAHRSIQEYLAGCDYADNGRFPELLQHLDDRQWWTVITFAVGQFALPQASAVVSRILDAAMARDGEERRSLILLAAECYIAKGSLQPKVAERVRNLIEEVFPPTSMDEAEMVARGGSRLLPLLVTHEEFSQETRAACIRAAALIGGSDALQVIADYAASSESTLVLNELVNSWQRFQPAEYVERVLNRTLLGENWISLKTRQIIAAASGLQTIKRVRVEAFENSFDFGSWIYGRSVEELDMAGNWRLRGLHGLSSLSGLRKLNLSGARSLESLNEVGELESLRELYLSGCVSVADLSPITRLKELRVLILDDCLGVTDFTPLSQLPQLIMLSVNRCRLSSLEFSAGLPRVRRIHALTRDGISDASAIASCANLQRLELKMKAGARNELELPRDGSLRKLVLNGDVRAEQLQHVDRHTELQELVLSKVKGLTDLSILHGLIGLQVAKIIDCVDLNDASALGSAADLHDIDLSGSAVRDIDFVRGMTKLSRVVLNRCPRLRRVGALVSLPSLEYVSLLNSGVELEPRPDLISDMCVSRYKVVVAMDPRVMVDDRILTGEHVDDYDQGDDYQEEGSEIFGGEFYGPTG